MTAGARAIGSTSTMTRLLVPADGPVWLDDFTRSIEQALREARTPGFVVTATGTAASQDITLPRTGIGVDSVTVFENGALRVGDYTIAGRTLTLTAASGATIVIIER